MSRSPIKSAISEGDSRSLLLLLRDLVTLIRVQPNVAVIRATPGLGAQVAEAEALLRRLSEAADLTAGGSDDDPEDEAEEGEPWTAPS